MAEEKTRELQEYIETIDLSFEGVGTKPYWKIGLLEFPYLAAGTATIVEELRRNSIKSKDIFEGINLTGKGEMTAFKDGTGFMGTLRENGKIVGQEHFFKLDVSSTMGSELPLLGAIAAIAITVGEFEKQIIDIQNKLEEIKSMLRFKEDSEIEAACEMLLEFLRKYKDGRDRLDAIEQYKGVAVQKILYYKKMILGKCSCKRVKKEDIDEVLGILEYYLFSLRVYSLASFLEIIYAKDFDHEDIVKAKEAVRKKAQEYYSISKSVQELIEKYKKEAGKKANWGVDLTFAMIEMLVNKGSVPVYSIASSPGERVGEAVGAIKAFNDEVRLKQINMSIDSKGVGLKRFDYLDTIMNEKYGFLIDEEYLYLPPV